MEHQVQQPPALLIAEHRGEKGVVYATAKESRAYDCSKNGANRQPAGAVHQTESCIAADKGVKPLLIAGRGVFCCPQSCASERTKAHQGHFQGQAPDRGGFFSVLNGRNKKFFRKFGKVTKKRLTNHTFILRLLLQNYAYCGIMKIFKRRLRPYKIRLCLRDI